MQNGREADPRDPFDSVAIFRRCECFFRRERRDFVIYTRRRGKMNARRIHSCVDEADDSAQFQPRGGLFPSREDRVTTLDSFHFSDSGQAESAANRYVPSGWSDGDDGTCTPGRWMRGTINHKAYVNIRMTTSCPRTHRRWKCNRLPWKSQLNLRISLHRYSSTNWEHRVVTTIQVITVSARQWNISFACLRFCQYAG